MMGTTHRAKNRLGLRLTKDAVNSALNAPSLENTGRMEDRNRAFFIVSRMLEGQRLEQKP